METTILKSDNENDKAQAEKIISEIYNVYKDCKSLFIKSEELLPEMRMFIPPLMEHRDAFDHLMRVFEKNQTTGQIDFDNLNKALGHEARAYFDVADYACIKIREYINNSLKKFSKKKIAECWKEYKSIRSKVFLYSEELYKVRNERSASSESITKYKEMIMPYMFEVLQEYITEIEPKLMKK